MAQESRAETRTYPEVRRGQAGEAPVPPKPKPRDPHRDPRGAVLLLRGDLAPVGGPPATVIVPSEAGGHGGRGVRRRRRAPRGVGTRRRVALMVAASVLVASGRPTLAPGPREECRASTRRPPEGSAAAPDPPRRPPAAAAAVGALEHGLGGRQRGVPRGERR
jgi:hypothetical protein